MTHEIGTRMHVRGVLETDAPVRIGAWEARAGADLTVARDGLGKVVIPGTSVAGALRAIVHTARGEDAANRLFGYLQPRTECGSPSWVRVEDAQILTDPVIEIRDGVGIDRRSGSAAKGFLYQHEVLAPGTRFALRITLDLPRSDNAKDIRTSFEQMLEVMAAGFELGAGRTKGMGVVRFTEVERAQENLASAAGMRAWLTNRQWERSITQTSEHTRPGVLRVTIDWRPLTPTYVQASASGTSVDSLPLTEKSNGQVRLLIPGSSVKGVLRAHAERIVRTLARVDAEEDLRTTLREERLPFVTTLFGAGGAQLPAGTDDDDKTPRTRQDPPQPAGAPAASADDDDRTRRAANLRGVLDARNVRSRSSVCEQQWRDIVEARAPQPNPNGGRQTHLDARHRAALLSALANAGIRLHPADHVAIDRWTGGAAENLLFSVLEPTGKDWEPMVLDVDTRRLSGLAQDHTLHGDTTRGARGLGTGEHGRAELAAGEGELCLLMLLLQDLQDGWLSFGHATTRGNGSIQVCDISFSGRALDPPWEYLAGMKLTEALADERTSAVFSRWRTDWSSGGPNSEEAR